MSDDSPSRFRTAMFIAGWAIVVAALVHIDWHLGRPSSMRLSLDWDFHWLLGLGAGIWMARAFARRIGSGRAGAALIATGLLGFGLGQIVQPGLEAIANGVAFATANPPVRWSLFAAFSVAWLVGSVGGLAFSHQRAERLPRR